MYYAILNPSPNVEKFPSKPDDFAGSCVNASITVVPWSVPVWKRAEKALILLYRS